MKLLLNDANPLVIDYFLGHNQNVQKIGKILIALEILECERQSQNHTWNENRKKLPIDNYRPNLQGFEINCSNQNFKDDWCRFVIHQLTQDCRKSDDLLLNKVNFITFNYDLSLEQRIEKGLRALKLFNEEHIKAFLHNRILHVYGNILSTEEIPRIKFAHIDRITFKNFFDLAYKSAQTIRTIGPEEKMLEKTIKGNAKNFLSNAKVVYILGFGFDKNNCTILNLEKYLKGNQHKYVLFTNYENSNRINKNAGHLFLDNYETFLDRNIYGQPIEGEFYYEKSVRNVYEALEKDFDTLESR